MSALIRYVVQYSLNNDGRWVDRGFASDEATAVRMAERAQAFLRKHDHIQPSPVVTRVVRTAFGGEP